MLEVPEATAVASRATSRAAEVMLLDDLLQMYHRWESFQRLAWSVAETDGSIQMTILLTVTGW